MSHKIKVKGTECYCGSGKPFTACCEPYITGKAIPETAEQLMRSRYSAYVECNEPYVLATWHESTRPEKLKLMTRDVHWLRLKVVSSELGKKVDNEGYVEFIAFHKINGKAHKMHEKSHFLKEGERWFYVDGEVEQAVI